MTVCVPSCFRNQHKQKCIIYREIYNQKKFVKASRKQRLTQVLLRFCSKFDSDKTLENQSYILQKKKSGRTDFSSSFNVLIA